METRSLFQPPEKGWLKRWFLVGGAYCRQRLPHLTLAFLLYFTFLYVLYNAVFQIDIALVVGFDIVVFAVTNPLAMWAATGLIAGAQGGRALSLPPRSALLTAPGWSWLLPVMVYGMFNTTIGLAVQGSPDADLFSASLSMPEHILRVIGTSIAMAAAAVVSDGFRMARSCYFGVDVPARDLSTSDWLLLWRMESLWMGSFILLSIGIFGLAMILSLYLVLMNIALAIWTAAAIYVGIVEMAGGDTQPQEETETRTAAAGMGA